VPVGRQCVVVEGRRRRRRAVLGVMTCVGFVGFGVVGYGKFKGSVSQRPASANCTAQLAEGRQRAERGASEKGVHANPKAIEFSLAMTDGGDEMWLILCLRPINRPLPLWVSAESCGRLVP